MKRLFSRVPSALLAFLLLLFWNQAEADSKWLDRSHSVFLPPELSEKLGAHQSFPVFWWNFVVLEFDDEAQGLQQASRICGKLSTGLDGLVFKTGCTQHLQQFFPMVQDWAKDDYVRSPAPSFSALTRKLDLSQAKATLPLGPTLLEILRVDPMESFQGLLSRVKESTHIDLPQKNGFYTDSQSKRILIPVQMSFPPSMTVKSLKFREKLNAICQGEDYCERIFLLGPHGSTLENEDQVNQDVTIVSRTGTLLLIILGIGAVLGKRYKLFLLVPPVLLSTLLSTVLTILIFGSIHGLTLSFGTGIIGLAMDYSLHSVFNQRYPGIWKANLYGLLTTIVALVLMMFTSIPLLQQIMVFATLGLILGYTFYYFLDRAFPSVFDVKPLALAPSTSRLKFGIVLVLLLFSGIGLATLKLNLDIRLFNFQTEKNADLTAWLYRHMEMRVPLLQIYQPASGQSPLKLAHEQENWAAKNQIKLEGIADFLPEPSVHERNRESWNSLVCSDAWKRFPDVTRKLFQPFFEKRSCNQLDLVTLEEAERLPAYVKDFFGNQKWISLWFPKGEAEVERVKQKYPGSLSLKEVVSIFPQTLARELKWMAPLSLLLAIVLLGIYYQKVYPTLLGLIPFFTGLGLFALGSLVFQLNVSFITVIALVMVFGCSIDYGVFAVDLAIGKKRSNQGVWSALSLSAVTTIIGFIPLLLCKHPVLKSLGQPLVLGTLGTYLGTVWGISGCTRFVKKFERT